MLQLDHIETKQRLLKTSSTISLTPGDYTSLPLPNNYPPQCLVLVQPNLQQAPPFFKSNIVQAENGHVSIKNESENVITFRKNSQPVTVQRVTETPIPRLPSPTEEPQITPLEPQDIINKVSFDSTNKLTRSQKAPFIETVKNTSEYSNLISQVITERSVQSSQTSTSRPQPVPAHKRSTHPHTVHTASYCSIKNSPK